MAAKQSNLMVARIPMGYNGQQLDRGQVFEGREAVNRQKLLELKYMAPFEGKEDELVVCNGCGGQFISDGFRTGHGNLRHQVFNDPLAEDAAFERLDRELSAAPPVGKPETITVH